ncbi:MAG: hypothetical protein FGM33_01225 [Candidatus Kapabacteria bacterium]|nr:hypothetical protein [Candidatus Kapabacteria bacterium]
MTEVQRPVFSVRGVSLTIAVMALLTLLVGSYLGDANPYSSSFNARIELYREKLDSLNRIRGWRDRIYMRHVANLEIPEYVVSKLRPNDVLLLPPMEYGNQFMANKAYWTDPRIFTWMVGFQPIVAWRDTARRKQANAYVVLEANTIWITRPGGSTNIDSLLAVYDKLGGGQ